jgi:nucleoside-diphosphate-sugar epimerase
MGADRVVHCAARAGDVGDIEPFLRDNVDATVRLAQKAARVGVTRFVHVSSISVYGLRSLDEIDETVPTEPIEGYPYAESKRRSEEELAKASTDGMEVVVCRLGSVYGPGSHHWTNRPLTLMTKSPIGMLLVDGGGGLQNPIYLDDAASGLWALATHPDANAGAYFLTDDSVEYKDFFAGYAEALGEPFRARELSKKNALRLAGVMETIARWRGKEALLTRIAVQVLCRRTTFSSAKLRRVTGWAPATSLAAGQRACAAWFRA